MMLQTKSTKIFVDLFLQQQFLCQKFLHKKFLCKFFVNFFFATVYSAAYIFVCLIKMTVLLNMQKNVAQIMV